MHEEPPEAAGNANGEERQRSMCDSFRSDSFSFRIGSMCPTSPAGPKPPGRTGLAGRRFGVFVGSGTILAWLGVRRKRAESHQSPGGPNRAVP